MSWKGQAVVAFVDLLGFTNRLFATWGQQDGALEQLIQLKAAVAAAPNGFAVEDGMPAASRETTLFSDSIIITSRVPQVGSRASLMSALASVYLGVDAASRFAYAIGFGVRGGVELGEVYWSGTEAIGPGAIHAYHLESAARNARVMLGPTLLRAMADDGTCRAYAHDLCYRCLDGTFALYPPAGYRDRIQAIRDQAPENIQSKYDEVLLHAQSGDQLTAATFTDARPAHLIRAARACEAVIAQSAHHRPGTA